MAIAQLPSAWAFDLGIERIHALSTVFPAPTGRNARPEQRRASIFEALEKRTLLSSALHGPLSVDQLMRLAAGEDPWQSSVELPATQPDSSAGDSLSTTTSSVSAAFVGPVAATNTEGSGPTNPGSTPTPRPASDFRYILRPGNGWTGPTPQPAPVGAPGTPGYDAKAIARWDVVPYQTFDDLFHIGVVAFHINGIDRVEFSVNGGDWTAVRTMTQNPQTDVYEYTATLRAQDFQDGPLEVRAIAWPTVGEARVLESLPLNSNGNHTLPTLVRWVSPTGNDTTGDGTQTKPFATMMKAARSIQDAQGNNADGGTIYLTEGDHVYGTYVWGMDTATENRFLTITAAPGLEKSQVRLTSAGNTNGLSTRLVHVSGVTIAPPDQSCVLPSTGPTEDFLWIHNSELIGPGRTVPTTWAGGWSGMYITDSSISNASDGFSGELQRNVVVDNIGSDAFTDSGLVVNCSVSNIDHRNTDFHPDVVQFYGRSENLIVYGLRATHNIYGQGLYPAPHGVNMRDIAFVNCVVDNTTPGNYGYVFQSIGNASHMYIKGCDLRGPAQWRVDLGFTAHNVVVEDTVFHGGITPTNVPGVTYR